MIILAVYLVASVLAWALVWVGHGEPKAPREGRHA